MPSQARSDVAGALQYIMLSGAKRPQSSMRTGRRNSGVGELGVEITEAIAGFYRGDRDGRGRGAHGWGFGSEFKKLIPRVASLTKKGEG